jgi:hypothetical protein
LASSRQQIQQGARSIHPPEGPFRSAPGVPPTLPDFLHDGTSQMHAAAARAILRDRLPLELLNRMPCAAC